MVAGVVHVFGLAFVSAQCQKLPNFRAQSVEHTAGNSVLIHRGSFSVPTFGLSRVAAQLLPSLSGLVTALAIRATTSVFGVDQNGDRTAALAEGVAAWAMSVILTVAFTMVNLKPLTLRGKFHVAKWTA